MGEMFKDNNLFQIYIFYFEKISAACGSRLICIKVLQLQFFFPALMFNIYVYPSTKGVTVKKLCNHSLFFFLKLYLR